MTTALLVVSLPSLYPNWRDRALLKYCPFMPIIQVKRTEHGDLRFRDCHEILGLFQQIRTFLFRWKSDLPTVRRFKDANQKNCPSKGELILNIKVTILYSLMPTRVHMIQRIIRTVRIQMRTLILQGDPRFVFRPFLPAFSTA